MCVICKNEYDNQLDLYIYGCQELTHIPVINNLRNLHINNCNSLIHISVTDSLIYLHVENCNSIKKIPIINNLINLYIDNCKNITKIPNITELRDLNITNSYISNIPILNKLSRLSLYDCNNIETIPKMRILMKIIAIKCNLLKNINIINNKYSSLHVINCLNINDCVFYKSNEITKFYSVNKIKNWYNRIKLSKKLWKYAEIILIDLMNPHKENNQYLHKYINNHVYKE